MFALVTLAVTTFGAQQAPSVEQQILQLQHQRFQAAIAQDLDTLDSIVADGLTYVRGAGTFTDTKAAYIERVRSGTKWSRIEPENPKVFVYGDVAVVTEFCHETVIPEPGQQQVTPYVRTLEVWVKNGGRWQWKHYQSTTVQANQALALPYAPEGRRQGLWAIAAVCPRCVLYGFTGNVAHGER